MSLLKELFVTARAAAQVQEAAAQCSAACKKAKAILKGFGKDITVHSVVNDDGDEIALEVTADFPESFPKISDLKQHLKPLFVKVERRSGRDNLEKTYVFHLAAAASQVKESVSSINALIDKAIADVGAKDTSIKTSLKVIRKLDSLHLPELEAIDDDRFDIMVQARLEKCCAVKEDVITERYEDSSDFDADYNAIEKHLKDALKIVQSANWKKHLKDTDANFSTEAVSKGRDAEGLLSQAIEEFKEFYDHIVEEAQ
jgi:hypothetical protein